MTNGDTRERRAIRESKGNRGNGPRISQWSSWLLAALFVLQVVLVVVLSSQYERYQHQLRTDIVDRGAAVTAIVCVLQLPQAERTDENVAQCLEQIDQAQ